MTNPPPKLTAEEEFVRQVACAANPCCLDAEIEFEAARKNLRPLILEHDATIRRQAFEEAAEDKMKVIDVKSEIIEIDEDGNVTPADATVVRDSGDAHLTPKPSESPP